MPVNIYADLPIAKQDKWDPGRVGRVEIENEILGDNMDWARYRKAHIWYDSKNQKVKAGHKLIIARMVNGKLKVIPEQLGAAIASINGARGGVNLSTYDRRRAYNHAIKYYKKMGVPREDIPKFKGEAMKTSQGQPVALAINEAASNLPDNITITTTGTGTVNLPYDHGSVAQLEQQGDDSPKWVQIAEEGDYWGYNHGNDPFRFTIEHFEQIIKNFRNHPAYQADSGGVGIAEVVPWDFGHASEYHATDGTLPVEGAPAQGWTLELEIRSSSTGKSELWALTKFLEPAKQYVKDKKYKWASVAVAFEAVDPVTGENVGALLTSIALTNSPFIEGMEELVAERKEVESQPRQVAANASNKKRREEMSEKFIQELAEILDVRDNEAAITGAIQDGIMLRKDVQSKFHLEKDGNKILLEAVESALETVDRFKAIASALGVENADDALAEVLQRIEDGERLKSLLPEYEELKASMAAQQEKEAETDVDTVISSRKFSAEVRDALLLFRKQQPEKFAEQYPPLSPEQVQATKKKIVDSAPENTPNLAQVIDLGRYEGRNTLERAISYLRETDDAAKDLTWEAINIRASQLKRQVGVIDSRAQ